MIPSPQGTRPTTSVADTWVADELATRREAGLTKREVEVLGLLAQRYTDREIADRLFISPRTATTHVSRILAKLGVDGRRQAPAAAERLGLLAS